MHHTNYILCVDVTEEDCEFLTESLHSFEPEIDLVFLPSGDQAVDFVKHETVHAPSIVILDINIPGMDGKRTFLELRELLGEDAYPAMFLTITPSPVDIAFAEEHGVL